MKNVYLAGPITGLSYNESVDWRENFKRRVASEFIKCFSPMRAKKYLEREKKIESSYDERLDINKLAPILSSGKGITTRDRWDCTRCDVLVANFLGAKTVSIGTVMEIAWADMLRKPIVVIMEESGNIHEHVMIDNSVGFRTTSIEEASDIVKALLGD